MKQNSQNTYSRPSQCIRPTHFVSCDFYDNYLGYGCWTYLTRCTTISTGRCYSVCTVCRSTQHRRTILDWPCPNWTNLLTYCTLGASEFIIFCYKCGTSDKWTSTRRALALRTSWASIFCGFRHRVCTIQFCAHNSRTNYWLAIELVGTAPCCVNSRYFIFVADNIEACTRIATYRWSTQCGSGSVLNNNYNKNNIWKQLNYFLIF